MRAGGLPADAASLLGGAALVCSFVLLYRRRLRACVAACAAQGWAVALAAAWQGWAAEEGLHFALVAAMTLAVNGILLPLTLARIAERRPGPVEPAVGVFASMLLGLLLVAVAVVAVRPAALTAAMLTGEDLAVALSIVLLGVAVMVGRRNAILQSVGMLSFGNGLILAVAGVPGMPMAPELAAAALALGALAVLGLSDRVRGRHR